MEKKPIVSKKSVFILISALILRVGMAKRKSRKSRAVSRRRTQSISLINTAELLVTTNILTQGLFNANIGQFVTGKHHNNISGGTPFYNPSTTDSIITLPELFGMDGKNSRGQRVAVFADPSAALATITANAKMNAVPMIMQTVGAKVFFTVLKRGTRKQRTFINKGFRMVGLNEVKA